MNETFHAWLFNNWESTDLCPPELEYKDAIKFLKNYLLGEDWYFVMSVNGKQGNVYIVSEILYKYSKKYRKECRKRQKEIDRGK